LFVQSSPKHFDGDVHADLVAILETVGDRRSIEVTLTSTSSIRWTATPADRAEAEWRPAGKRICSARRLLPPALSIGDTITEALVAT
jgi:hypothetical protein